MEEHLNLIKWTDLKIGDILTDGTQTSMVISIDKHPDTHYHILLGDKWVIDKNLVSWELVKEE